MTSGNAATGSMRAKIKNPPKLPLQVRVRTDKALILKMEDKNSLLLDQFDGSYYKKGFVTTVVGIEEGTFKGKHCLILELQLKPPKKGGRQGEVETLYLIKPQVTLNLKPKTH